MNVDGKVIKTVRPLTEEELEDEGWEDERGSVLAIELTDGTLIYPSRDEEGNGPGSLFGKNGHDKFYLGYDEAK